MTGTRDQMVTTVTLLSRQPTRRRIFLAVACGVAAATITLVSWSRPNARETQFGTILPPDFSVVWTAARALLAGDNPYAVVGPGRTLDIPFGQPYPLPAVVVALPFAVLPMIPATALFVGVSMGLLTYALLARGLHPALLGLASGAGLVIVSVGQWSALMTASALMPSLGFLLAAKPTIGAALWVAYPSWRSALGAIGFTLLATIFWPGWIGEWWAQRATVSHLAAPIMYAGGPLVLLALRQWSQPEARLLVALACVPQTANVYETLPLFLCTKTTEESVTLLCLSYVVFVIGRAVMLWPWPDRMAITGMAITLLMYLPVLVMVLRRGGNDEIRGLSGLRETKPKVQEFCPPACN